MTATAQPSAPLPPDAPPDAPPAAAVDTRPVAVAAIDDHPAMLEGVRASLSAMPGIRLVASAPTVPALVEALERSGERPDVVLLDLRLADGSLPATNVRGLVNRGWRVMVYTTFIFSDQLRSAVAEGALAVVGKAEPLEDLAAAIRSVAAGEPFLTTEWAAALDAAPVEQRPVLSERESQALRLYASGLEMKSAARRMGIALATYKEYLLRIRRKYADVDRPAGTKLDLYHRAVEDGYLHPDGGDRPGRDRPQPPAGED